MFKNNLQYYKNYLLIEKDEEIENIFKSYEFQKIFVERYPLDEKTLKYYLHREQLVP